MTRMSMTEDGGTLYNNYTYMIPRNTVRWPRCLPVRTGASGIMSLAKSPNMINFASGQPPENLLPFKLVADAASKLLSEYVANGNCTGTVSPLSYGDKTNFFCQRLASFLVAECGREFVNPDLLVPTAGVSNALDLISTMLCKNLPRSKQGVVFVEDATYYLSMGIFEDHDLAIYTIPMDEDGVIVSDFRQILEDMSSEGSALVPLFFYTIPTFHNPTGRTMPIQRRVELLMLTKEYNVFVVADEVYQMLGFTEYLQTGRHQMDSLSQAYYPTLVSIPCPGATNTSTGSASGPTAVFDHVISVSSFSKILAPGLRVGWAEFSSLDLLQRFKSLGVLRSGSSISHFSSCVAVSCMLGSEDEQFDGDGNKTAIGHFVPTIQGAEDTSMSASSCAPVGKDDDIASNIVQGRGSYNKEMETDCAVITYCPCQLRQHIRHLRETLAQKYEALTSALMRYSDEFLSKGNETTSNEIRIEGFGSDAPIGGYFLWIELPAWCAASDPKLSPARLLAIAGEPPYNILFTLGDLCRPPHARSVARHREHIRMCFAKLSIVDLKEGARRFCLLLRDHQPVNS